ncbi:HpcH/HpaI aldolase family protein [Variovorax sp. MHTC-1]|uniref:HpcH/HpaI aldolase family protein n=1 Tax=Variovorax sp. MHTC-1 TaxID=2495593 RepID=UPI000F87880A|nr:aldolase/citrate lyase family protein [Variovorax sp. MHTC-1]RST49410.1 4-hydroxy-2-oxo-heptane-1,7-dioate aldolase [Variovorax sp. MHTC-1]
MPVLPNHFKRALAAQVPQIGLWSTLPDPYISEIVAGAGFDWMLLDTEHTPTEVPQMLRQLQAVAAAVPMDATRRTSAVVRPDWNDTVLIKRYLDIGAQSLLLPFVQNAAEAQTAVRATRYAPQGVRGMGGSVRAANFGRIRDYVKGAQEELCVLVQVETREALDHLEEIAAVDGIDGVFIGPADLSASLGHPGEPNHPEVRSAIDDAIRCIRALGKAPGILMLDETRARECLELGALFVAVAMDLQILARGAEAAAARFASHRPAAADIAY